MKRRAVHHLCRALDAGRILLIHPQVTSRVLPCHMVPDVPDRLRADIEDASDGGTLTSELYVRRIEEGELVLVDLDCEVFGEDDPPALVASRSPAAMRTQFYGPPHIGLVLWL
jgi:hypothetical protein